MKTKTSGVLDKLPLLLRTKPTQSKVAPKGRSAKEKAAQRQMLPGQTQARR